MPETEHAILKTDLQFTPALDDFFASRTKAPYTALAGANNSGKSLVLKWLKASLGRTAHMIGVNRFYHVYHIGSGLRNPEEIDQYERQFLENFWQEQYNHEQNYIDLNRIILNLNNKRREELFELCGRLLGMDIGMRKVDDDNELSPWYIEAAGQNLSVASSGTRLLMTIMGICMDERFSTMLIDEPELGLGPRIQSAVAGFLQDGVSRAKYFPHLSQVFVATHSQIFLDRREIQSNFVVAKDGVRITVDPIKTIGDFHRLQFNLLGNALETLFLPSAFVIVEGATDLIFLQRLVELRLPTRNIAVLSAQGDIKRKISGLRDLLGDFAKSPYRDRIFAVLDSVHPHGLRTELEAQGLTPEHVIVWERNGVEFVYPPSIMGTVFGCDPERAATIQVTKDTVSLNGIEKKKMDLAKEVATRLTSSTQVPPELETKLMGKLSHAIG